MTYLISFRAAASVVMYASMTFLMGSGKSSSNAVLAPPPTTREKFAAALTDLQGRVRALPNYGVTEDDADLHALFA